MEHLIIFILTALAIERATEVATRVELLEAPRRWFQGIFRNSVGKLAYCKFCQCFWLSGIVAWLLPFPLLSFVFESSSAWPWVVLPPWAPLVAKTLILWPALWGAALALGGMMERLVDGTPNNLFVTYRRYEEDAMGDEGHGS